MDMCVHATPVTLGYTLEKPKSVFGLDKNLFTQGKKNNNNNNNNQASDLKHLFHLPKSTQDVK